MLGLAEKLPMLAFGIKSRFIPDGEAEFVELMVLHIDCDRHPEGGSA
jgi:hypothetical protein